MPPVFEETHGSTLSESGPWRTLEISTHQPGPAMLKKFPIRWRIKQLASIPEENRFMESHTTQTFSLTPEQTHFVEKCIASGRFKSTDEVVTEGFRLLKAEEAEYQEALQRARRLVKEGVDAVERGEWVEGETFLDQMAQRRTRLKAKLDQ